jgi:hypothetical protein
MYRATLHNRSINQQCSFDFLYGQMYNHDNIKILFKTLKWNKTDDIIISSQSDVFGYDIIYKIIFDGDILSFKQIDCVDIIT